jgi:hypothetical protein
VTAVGSQLYITTLEFAPLRTKIRYEIRNRASEVFSMTDIFYIRVKESFPIYPRYAVVGAVPQLFGQQLAHPHIQQNSARYCSLL